MGHIHHMSEFDLIDADLLHIAKLQGTSSPDLLWRSASTITSPKVASPVHLSKKKTVTSREGPGDSPPFFQPSDSSMNWPLRLAAQNTWKGAAKVLCLKIGKWYCLIDFSEYVRILIF